MTKIEALPSVILEQNRNFREINSLTFKEKEKWNKTVCKRLENVTKSMFVDRPEEWNNFVKVITS